MKYVLLPSGDVYEMTNNDYRRYLEFVRSGGDFTSFKKFNARYFATPTNLVLHLTADDAREELIHLNTKD